MGNNWKQYSQYMKRIAQLIRINFFMNSNTNCCTGKVYGICKNNHILNYNFLLLLLSLLQSIIIIHIPDLHLTCFVHCLRSPSSSTGSIPSSFLGEQSGGAIKKSTGVEPCDVVALAKEALSASKQAVLLAEYHKQSGANIDESLTLRYLLHLLWSLSCRYIFF